MLEYTQPEEIEVQIKDVLERFIIEEVMHGDEKVRLQPDQSLIKSGLLDSIAFLRLVGFIEEAFNVAVKDEEILPANFDSIQAIENFLVQKMDIVSGSHP